MPEATRNLEFERAAQLPVRRSGEPVEDLAAQHAGAGEAPRGEVAAGSFPHDSSQSFSLFATRIVEFG